MPKTLDSCAKVFVRRLDVKPPLTPPYRGPYEVIERFPNHFVLDIDGRRDSVSILRLKPAFTEAQTLEGLQVYERNRHGRIVSL